MARKESEGYFTFCNNDIKSYLHNDQKQFNVKLNDVDVIKEFYLAYPDVTKCRPKTQ